MIIIDKLQNQKLAKYYNGNNISNSLKSMIHVNTIITYKIQLPDKVWDLIKQFILYYNDEPYLAIKIYKYNKNKIYIIKKN